MKTLFEKLVIRTSKPLECFILNLGGVFYICKHMLPSQMASRQLSVKQGRFGDCEKLMYNN